MIAVFNCDILILGAGLAGLTTAISALEHYPSLDVMVITPAAFASGSSFTNSNNALGMQVLKTDTEKSLYIETAVRIATPGHIDKTLVEIMAEESNARYQDMKKMGIEFEQSPNGEKQKFNACFNADMKSARIFRGLSRVHELYKGKAERLGAKINFRTSALKLIKSDRGEIVGAILKNGKDIYPAYAKAVIMAVGGPSPLFKWNMAGKGATGIGYGIMSDAGAELKNTGFIQFMWNRTDNRRFVSPALLAAQDAFLLPEHGPARTLGQALDIGKNELQDLIRQRQTHCPAAYGQKDNLLDKTLRDCLDESGTIAVELNREKFTIAPMAHAGNGGAIVDCQAKTTVKGLWAVGECATGMHGANRVGGGSVLATQVFGRIAGISAARHCASLYPAQQLHIPVDEPGSSPKMLEKIRDEMQKHAVLGGGSDISRINHWLESVAKTESGRDKILAKSAAAITNDLTTHRKY